MENVREVAMQPESLKTEVYIARQLIIDRKERIVGYELLYRHAADATRAAFDDDLAASTEMLSTLLTHIGIESLLGDGLAFLNVPAAMLDSDFIDLLPPQRVVLEILGAAPRPSLSERCRQLRARGFRIALDNVLASPANAPLLDAADYVKLDIQRLPAAAMSVAVEALRRYPLQLIAEKVETPAEFRRCLALSFDGFQGYHFARPETLAARAINPALVRVIELLNMVRGNAEFDEIEAALKCDVALSVRLLRFINSVGFGLSSQVRSLQHALTLLGYRQLYRWLSLLLLAADDRSTNVALARTALTRGRLTELLGKERLEGYERDNLFIVGLFSLIDAILNLPMDKAIDALSLPDGIREALLHRRGVYGAFLDLAEACEGGDGNRLDVLARHVGLSPQQINEAHLSALRWAEEIAL